MARFVTGFERFKWWGATAVEFNREAWKLGIILFGIVYFFDFVSSWTFFGKVVVGPSLQNDLEKSGHDFDAYKDATIALCVLQVFVCPVRIALCFKHYSRLDVLGDLVLQSEGRYVDTGDPVLGGDKTVVFLLGPTRALAFTVRFW